MAQALGRSLPLSLPRQLVCDLLHFARKTPAVSVSRRLRLEEVAAARAVAEPRPSWAALFTKGYALVAAGNATLRRAYLGLPYPRLYEHPVNVAAVAVERLCGGEETTFLAPLPRPESLSLSEIDARLLHYHEAPVAEIACFRRALRAGRWPRPLRLLAWFGLNWSGRLRARAVGTFGLSVVPGLGPASHHPLSALSNTLNVGPVDEHGGADVRLVCDPRVLTGGAAARALAELERVLRQEMLTELRYCRGLEAA